MVLLYQILAVDEVIVDAEHVYQRRGGLSFRTRVTTCGD